MGPLPLDEIDFSRDHINISEIFCLLVYAMIETKEGLLIFLIYF